MRKITRCQMAIEPIKTKEGMKCQRCKNSKATKDYLEHSEHTKDEYWVCDHCHNMLEKEFEEDYR